MGKRARYKDVEHVKEDGGKPEWAKVGKKRRHRIRKAKANSNNDKAREAIERAGATLEIKNSGHHWIITFSNDVWEWWPSSAKLVRNKTWKQGIHVHSWQKVLETIQERR